MHEILTEIDAIFDEPATVDESGCLELALAHLRRHGVSACFLVAPCGSVRLMHPRTHALPARVDPQLLPGAAEPSHPERVHLDTGIHGPQPVAFLPLPQEEEEERGWLGLLLDPDAEPPHLERRERSEVLALARCAARYLRLARRLDQQRTRSRHLQNEERVLRRAFGDTIDRVLEEREQHLREKREHIDQLEREVEKRSAALREALERAEQANRAKSVFLANMSHEIRTPMTAILGYAEALLDPSVSEAERLNAVHTIRRNGQLLLDIINDILDHSKIENGQMKAECEPCDLPELLSDVYSLMRARSEAKGVPLVFRAQGAVPRVIRTDPTRLRQILINLVGNAIKFTDAGYVRVTVCLCPPAPGADPAAPPQLQFSVTDTGIGIAPEHQARIFDPFCQADSSTTRKFGGTGLGLAICRRLTELLGGQIDVESELAVGSTFRARIDPGPLDGVELIDQPALELALASAARPAAIEHLELQRPIGRVLVAEDGPDNQRLICFILRKAGAHVTIAENGRLAVDLALRALADGAPYDLILMDMQMPVMDGYAATAELRAAGYTHPIIALTAHAMSGDRERCLATGCNEFATKPIDRADLLAKIHRILRAREAGSA
jgi:signal transduction histidine kinase/CheY-like chemotaxis protein